MLTRQYSSYPFHLTRPFALGGGSAGVATLYLQSASGGLYRDDDLAVAIDVGSGAAAEVTTQASTVVHDTKGMPARLRQRAAVAAGGFLALWPDPTILLPGAVLHQEVDITLEAGASAVVAESWLTHDPLGLGRPFGELRSATIIRRGDGRTLVADRQLVRGSDWQLALGSAEGWLAAGSAFLLGAVADRVSPAGLTDTLQIADVAGGASALPHGAGIGVRLLARDGVALSAALTAVWRAAFRATFDINPAPRRK
ncbi:MAG: urease accessory protein UreD [Bauldia sp.]